MSSRSELGLAALDLLPASFATCAGLYVLVSCRARGIPTEELRLEQDHVAVSSGLRQVVVRVLMPVGFPDNYVEAVRAAADTCRVTGVPADSWAVEVVAVTRVSAMASPRDASRWRLD